jgi:hypothetical protein
MTAVERSRANLMAKRSLWRLTVPELVMRDFDVHKLSLASIDSTAYSSKNPLGRHDPNFHRSARTKEEKVAKVDMDRRRVSWDTLSFSIPACEMYKTFGTICTQKHDNYTLMRRPNVGDIHAIFPKECPN